MPLLEFRPEGIYCPKADVYVDPWRRVPKALITHGHADHSRWGHGSYLCTHTAKPVIRHRLGPEMKIESIGFGERRSIHGVNFSFHPAGHILGSAQIRVESQGEVWVVSGDYKLEDDGLSEPFELLKCHTFITESTFGLPAYKWRPQEKVMEEINLWWKENKEAGIQSVITAYSLGKAQRLLQGLDPGIGTIYTHGAVENINKVIRDQGISLHPTEHVHADISKKELAGSMLIAPPSVLGSPWLKRFQPYSDAIASGWMSLRGARRRRSADRGFVLSDHADWEGLNATVRASGAEKVFVTHGYSEIFSRWLKEQGISSAVVKTQFEGELSEMDEGKEEEENS